MPCPVLGACLASISRSPHATPCHHIGGSIVGLDIGCGANLIYPLLGACLAGWRMIGADCTPAALEWAARNLGANPQLAGLIELRAVGMQPEQAAYLQAAVAGAAAGKAAAAGTAGAASKAGPEPAAETGAPAAGQDGAAAVPAAAEGPGTSGQAAAAGAADGTSDAQAAAAQAQAEAEVEAEAVAAEAPAAAPAVASAAPAPVLRLSASQAAGSGIISGALRKGEQIAFCMCNPPFFESLEEAGRNPATAYGGTAPEMVYPGACGCRCVGFQWRATRVQENARLLGGMLTEPSHDVPLRSSLSNRGRFVHHALCSTRMAFHSCNMLPTGCCPALASCRRRTGVCERHGAGLAGPAGRGALVHNHGGESRVAVCLVCLVSLLFAGPLGLRLCTPTLPHGVGYLTLSVHLLVNPTWPSPLGQPHPMRRARRARYARRAACCTATACGCCAPPSSSRQVPMLACYHQK